MFTINKCSLGWVVRLKDWNGEIVEMATFWSLKEARGYVKRVAWCEL